MLQKCVNIKKEYLFFIHEFTGCDTTCAFYNKSKNSFIKFFNDDQKLRAIANNSMIEEQSEEVLFNCILTKYGAKIAKNLNELRYKPLMLLASKIEAYNLVRYLGQKMQQ